MPDTTTARTRTTTPALTRVHRAGGSATGSPLVRGFTLLEMIVVMAIMGILLSIGTTVLTDVLASANERRVELVATAFGQQVRNQAGYVGSTANPRQLTYLDDTAYDFASDHPEVAVAGITDANADGVDDDGRVSVTLLGYTKCVTVGTTPRALLAIADCP